MLESDLRVSVNGKSNYAIEKILLDHHYRIILKVEDNFVLNSAVLEIPYKFSNEEVLLNGFQTWSTSRLASIDSEDPIVSRLFNKLQGKYGDYALANYDFLHSWSYTYLKKNGYCRVIGSLNEENAFHFIAFDLEKNVIRIVLDVDELIVKEDSLELFNIYDSIGSDERIVDQYFNELNYETQLENRKYYGWTSWYQYYTDINETIILKNLEEYSKAGIDLDYFQVDDGYQKNIGDWLQVNSDFPMGMQGVADAIHKKGYKAGLWLAPFICEKRSSIYKNHQDWLIKDQKGKPLKIGYNPGWSGYYYALNILLPEVKKYLRYVFSTIIHEWKYDLLKLDFLFAAIHIHSNQKTRGKIMREAMVFLKEISQGAHIIACGVPLSSVYGLFEFSRVSSDVGLKWEDPLMKWLNFKERVSTINAIETSIARYHMNHQVFINDPDVFILRDENQKMTWDQRKTLLFVNLIFGSLIFTSDRISTYNKEQMALYNFTFKLKNSEIKNIKMSELIYVEITTTNEDYLFIINTSDQKTIIKLNNKWQKEYDIKPKEVRPYESLYVKK
jgi:alpha-galactosidase